MYLLMSSIQALYFKLKDFPIRQQQKILFQINTSEKQKRVIESLWAKSGVNFRANIYNKQIYLFAYSSSLSDTNLEFSCSVL